MRTTLLNGDNDNDRDETRCFENELTFVLAAVDRVDNGH
jgi:hypothetical protein